MFGIPKITALEVVGFPELSQLVQWQSSRRPKPGEVTAMRESTLSVAPSEGGKKAWFVAYRHGGRSRRHTFGSYPTMGLADARKKVQELKSRIAKGADPAGERKTYLRAETFEE